VNAKALTMSIEMRDRAKIVAALLSKGRDTEAFAELAIVRKLGDHLYEDLRVCQPWPDPIFRTKHQRRA